jgi:hypothetical protein
MGHRQQEKETKALLKRPLSMLSNRLLQPAIALRAVRTTKEEYRWMAELSNKFHIGIHPSSQTAST